MDDTIARGNEAHELELLRQYEAEHGAVSLAKEAPKGSGEHEQYETLEEGKDKQLLRFIRRVSLYPEQVVRYCFGVDQLWYHSKVTVAGTALPEMRGTAVLRVSASTGPPHPRGGIAGCGVRYRFGRNLLGELCEG